jgi:hypothetical protein
LCGCATVAPGQPGDACGWALELQKTKAPIPKSAPGQSLVLFLRKNALKAPPVAVDQQGDWLPGLKLEFENEDQQVMRPRRQQVDGVVQAKWVNLEWGARELLAARTFVGNHYDGFSLSAGPALFRLMAGKYKVRAQLSASAGCTWLTSNSIEVDLSR